MDDFFGTPPNEVRKIRTEETSLRLAARAWIESHPAAAQLLLQYARDLACHDRRFGVSLLVERLRWEGTMQGWVPGEYQVNNSIRSWIARWLIAQEPRLVAFITFRKVKD